MYVAVIPLQWSSGTVERGEGGGGDSHSPSDAQWYSGGKGGEGDSHSSLGAQWYSRGGVTVTPLQMPSGTVGVCVYVTVTPLQMSSGTVGG